MYKHDDDSENVMKYMNKLSPTKAAVFKSVIDGDTYLFVYLHKTSKFNFKTEKAISVLDLEENTPKINGQVIL
jgi:YHS domain-containing protein